MSDDDREVPTPKLTLSGVYEQSSGLEVLLRRLAEVVGDRAMLHEKVLSLLDLKQAKIERNLESEMLVHADRLSGWRKHNVAVDKRIEDISIFFALEARAKKIGCSLTS